MRLIAMAGDLSSRMREPGSQFVPWTVSALLMGVVLGGLFLLTGDLLAPIAVHFTVNLLNLSDIVRRELPQTALA